MGIPPVSAVAMCVLLPALTWNPRNSRTSAMAIDCPMVCRS